MSEPTISIDKIFGSKSMHTEYRTVDGAIEFWSWSITYDRHGKEVSRTEKECLSRAVWSGSKPPLGIAREIAQGLANES